MGGSEPPDRFKCRKAKFQDVSVGSKLPLDNLTPTVEDRENYGTFIKQPEIIAGQRDRRGQTPRQPAHFFARFDQNVGTGPFESGVVAQGFGDDAGATYEPASSGKPVDQLHPGAALGRFGGAITPTAGEERGKPSCLPPQRVTVPHLQMCSFTPAAREQPVALLAADQLHNAPRKRVLTATLGTTTASSLSGSVIRRRAAASSAFPNGGPQVDPVNGSDVHTADDISNAARRPAARDLGRLYPLWGEGVQDLLATFLGSRDRIRK